MSRSGTSGAKHRLMTELQALQKEKWVHFDTENANIQKWRFALMVINTDSAFNGGYFRAEMTFPDDYPYQPPKFRFLIPLYHPNIYPDGALCISILHKPGEDLMSGEQASERWSPLQGAESVLRSVLLLLDDPEIHSPANVDAGVLYRDRRDAYDRRARDAAAASRRDIPPGFVMPASFEPAPPPAKTAGLDDDDNDDDFWAESGGEDEYDFGGSDTGDDEDAEGQEIGEFGDGEEEDDQEEEEDMSDDDDQDDKRR